MYRYIRILREQVTKSLHASDFEADRSTHSAREAVKKWIEWH